MNRAAVRKAGQPASSQGPVPVGIEQLQGGLTELLQGGLTEQLQGGLTELLQGGLTEQLQGGLTELSGEGGVLTLAIAWVAEAQRQGETVAWVTERDSSFFPPDAARSGVDLEQLVIVRLLGRPQLPRAAESLLRSGGFGLVVIDLGARAVLPIPQQSRLAGLAKRHRAAVVCLTEKSKTSASLGSLVSLRIAVEAGAAESGRRDVQETGGISSDESLALEAASSLRGFEISARIVKDKRPFQQRRAAKSQRTGLEETGLEETGGGPWPSGESGSLRMACRGPDGLC